MIEIMKQAGNQQVLISEQSLQIRLRNWPPSCHRVWDSAEARFDKCFLPIISAIPAVVALCILLTIVIQHLLWHRPSWMEPFVKELPGLPEELFMGSKKRSPGAAFVLFLTSLLGFVPQVIVLLYSSFESSAAFLCTAWMAAGILVVTRRPKTTSMSLLALYSSLLLSHLVLFFDGSSKRNSDGIAAILGLLAGFVAIATVLGMPIRDPTLPTDEISLAFSAPDPQLRSPEDNLTLWQFMTVSWMEPLISLGATRQLHDSDIWALGYEFQHKRLHQRFRELRGSVLRRVIEANKIDLIIVSFLGAVELLANASTPVLLQQLLRSMGDLHAPRRAAVVYAVLSLVARLIAGQAAVFGLWFSRRSYERSRGEMITMLYEKMLMRKVIGLQELPPEVNRESEMLQESNTKNPEQSDEKHDQGKQSASMGKVLNLMRGDVYEVAQRFWESSSFVTKPLGLVVSTILIWRLIGWPCLIGVLTVFVAQAINALLGRAQLRWERVRRVATDSKLQIISQFVEAIRHLRWYGWQDAWLSQIMKARQHELNLRVVTSIWSALIAFTNNLASGMFPVAAFYAYTFLAGQPLRIDIAFPALQLFGILENHLREIPGLITAMLNAYIAVGRLEGFMSEPNKAETEVLPTGATQLELCHASFAWPGARQLVLDDVTLAFPPGLTVVCGKIAAGKTALLLALLGELDKISGDLIRPGETFGYCAQTPWLQSMSIRENILFSSPYEDSRYKQVIAACALTDDLANFKHGDLSNIGENGIGLSGGQKARVALARAVYSQASTLLLDDPLSALDQQTAEIIVRRCLGGPLLTNRTVVLVTHRTDLCYSLANQIVEISEGKARVLGSEASFQHRIRSRRPSDLMAGIGHDRDSEQQLAAVPDKFIEDEHRATGGVKARVYWAYIRAGNLSWWFVFVCVTVVYRLLTVWQSWFLKQWGEAYNHPAELKISILFGGFDSPEVNPQPWLLVFFLGAAAKALIFLISGGVVLVIIYTAGRGMFKDIMKHVTYATFRFYDVTPVGRLMNRLTSDIGTIDGNISEQFRDVAWLFIEWVSSVAVIASITPEFLVVLFVLSVGFILVFLRFLPTSQSLRRLEMVSLSPLMSNFGALSEGVTTVRAFGAQYRFQERVIAVTDTFQQMDHFYWSLQAWLMYRFDVLSASSTLILTLVAIYTGVSPGLTAFVLVAASKFVSSTHSLCRRYGQLQMDFVSVERVVELLHLEQEPSGSVQPPARWPSYNGDIVFEDVTIRYAPHLDPALSSISFRIRAGTNTALVGRTGSGKSTLALALLATTLPEAGRILIDGIDISTVDVQALRSRVTFLAQEPLLFPGSIHQNLDPLHQHTKGECEAVLEKICGGRYRWTLDMQIDAGGRNLSQGQRQLIGLARAVLRRSPVVILDEATASIDQETALRIQHILRKELRESTVITIAHRLEAVSQADYCIVLGEGKLVQQGPASEVLQQLYHPVMGEEPDGLT